MSSMNVSISEEAAEEAPTGSFARVAGSWLSSAEVPDRCVAISRRAVVDTLAVGVAAQRSGLGRELHDYLTAPSADVGSSIWGTTAKVHEGHAALVNGVLAHALDFDDVAYPFYGHPSAVIVPALMAVAPSCDATLQDVAIAHAVAVQVGNAIGQLNPHHYEQGFHATGTLGAVAAAAGVSRLLGLDADRATAAVAISASLGAGLRANVGTETKWLHAGNAAMQAVHAARMAGAGWHGMSDAFESKVGFAAAHGSPSREMERCSEALLGEWWGAVPGALGMKLHPSCACTHPGVDAAQALREHLGGDTRSIREVRIWALPLAREILVVDRPADSIGARFSLPFAVCQTLVHGRLELAAFDKVPELGADVDRLIRHTTMFTLECPSEFAGDSWATVVEIVCADGRLFRETVTLARGRDTTDVEDLDGALLSKWEECVGAEAAQQLMTMATQATSPDVAAESLVAALADASTVRQ